MITLQQLNRWSRELFIESLAEVFEHSPWVIERVAALRPFNSRQELLEALQSAVHAAPKSMQQALIRAHPPLGILRSQPLTARSAQEQRDAGLDDCSDEQHARLQTLNAEYSDKFGLPFILAVKGHTPASIIEAMERRLGSDPSTEYHTALNQIGIIGGYRLEQLVRFETAGSGR